KLILDAIARPDARSSARAASRPRADLDIAALRDRDRRIARCRLVRNALPVVAVEAGASGREVLERLLATLPEDAVTLLAVVSDDVDIEDRVELLWGITTRFDAARDVLFSRIDLQGAVPVYRGILGIDATWKQGYPEPLRMDPDVERRVDTRWREYFPRGG